MSKNILRSIIYFCLLSPIPSLIQAQSVTVQSSIFGTGSFITVDFANAPGNSGDWIGIFPYLGDQTSYVNWQWLYSQTSGSLTFPTPADNVLYNARMFDDTGAQIANSEPFVVKKTLRPDTGFNNTGQFHADYSGVYNNDQLSCVMIDQNQKIVVAGTVFTGDTTAYFNPVVRFMVARFLPNGTQDQSFGSNGKVLTDIPGIQAIEVTAMLIQPDGKIIVGGTGMNNGSWCVAVNSFILVRYNADGTLDQSFGTNGVVLTNFTWPAEPSGNSSDNLTSLALQPDGKILAGGYGMLCAENLRRCSLARYLSNGQLDSGFGTGGKLTFHAQWENEWIESIAPPVANGDGSFFVAVTWTSWFLFVANENRFYKFDSTGNLVPGFGTGGMVEEPLPGLSGGQIARSIQTGPDNKLYVMGCTGTFGWLWLMRRDPLTGAPDPTFGNNGLVVYQHSVSCKPVGMQFFNNRIVVGHQTINDNWASSRFHLNGAFDVTYGWPGYVFHDNADEVAGFAVQPDGKVVMAGSGLFEPGPQRDIMVVRFDTNTTKLLQYHETSSGVNDCFDSNENLYLYNFDVENGGTVNLVASGKILLTTGTSVASGGFLNARITMTGEVCSQPSSFIAANNLSGSFANNDQRVSDQSSFRVFPNPTDGRIQITYANDFMIDKGVVAVYGPMGNRISTMELSSSGVHLIDLTGFPAGVYIVRVSDGKVTESHKIIKQ